MRKKHLIEETKKLLSINDELYKDNKTLSECISRKDATIEELNFKVAALNIEIENLKAQINSINNNEVTVVKSIDVIEQEALETFVNDEFIPVQETQIKTTNKVTNYGSDVDKAAAAIGKVVLKCADLCEEFALLDNINSKDLVNLSLGRTEVFKSEVLSVVTEKRVEDIDATLEKMISEVFEYFELLKGQI